MENRDKPNLQTFDLLGRQSDRIIERLAGPRANAEPAPNSEPHRDNHDDDKQHDRDAKPDKDREVVAAGTERDTLTDAHGAPAFSAMRDGLEHVFGAIRETPRATRRDFRGAFGKAPKPDMARAKSRQRE